MKINCSYCGCPMDAETEKCPNCGGVNEKAAEFVNHHEQQQAIKEEARREAFESVPRMQAKARKIVFRIYGIIILLIFLPVITGIILAITNNVRDGKERVEREKQKQEQLIEEQRQKEKQEADAKAYDEAEVSVEGLNVSAEKDKYYSIQVKNVVPYELEYDHNDYDWGNGFTDAKYLHDGEHRVAIEVSVKNYQDKVTLYRNPSGFMGLYIDDENDSSIVIQEDAFLNGSENYYQGGVKISDTADFIDHYGDYLEKNQTMSWWVPVIVNEECEKIVLHFDYNMKITIDNPCKK